MATLSAVGTDYNHGEKIQIHEATVEGHNVQRWGTMLFLQDSSVTEDVMAKIFRPDRKFPDEEQREFDLRKDLYEAFAANVERLRGKKVWLRGTVDYHEERDRYSIKLANTERIGALDDPFEDDKNLPPLPGESRKSVPLTDQPPPIQVPKGTLNQAKPYAEDIAKFRVKQAQRYIKSLSAHDSPEGLHQSAIITASMAAATSDCIALMDGKIQDDPPF